MTNESFPYNDLSKTQKWPTACNWADFNIPVDPHENTDSKFLLDQATCVGSAGSCFAQRITQSLQANNFNYLITEKAPAFLPSSLAGIQLRCLLSEIRYYIQSSSITTTY